MAAGIVLAVFGMTFIRPLAVLMGAEGELLENSVLYGRIILAALPFYVLQYEFQCLFAVAEKPKLGLYITAVSGLANMVLDAVFVAGFRWGLPGAIYFGCRNSSPLRLGRCRFDGRALLKACANGSSELMSNISSSVVGMLYNIQLIRYAGENGVAAYGVLMYVSMVFQAVFIGYSVGRAPVIAYHYGAGNYGELKSLRQKGLVLIGIFSALMFGAGQVLARPLSYIFVGYDEELLEMTVHGFFIFSFSFLLSGISIFGSSFFTALNDGVTSALISFFRTLVFQCAMVILFPLLWGIEGIWLSVAAAELLAAAVTVLFLVGKQKRYHY